MNVKVLIDGIMQQTTVLIGQLSTAAGVRAPLSRVADQVFLELSRELEAQGVGKRVAADMFGLALRSYQKKVRRITESASVPQRTLWEAVLQFIQTERQTTRRAILNAFRADTEREIGAVLNDLVGSGLVYHTGHGRDSLYGVTSDDDQRRMSSDAARQLEATRMWAAVLERGAIGREALRADLDLQDEAFDAALSTLLEEGKLAEVDHGDGLQLEATDLLVPVGAEIGWELAVYDHFRAVVSALAAKLRNGQARSTPDDVVGGATLSFELTPGHPLEDRVRGLLATVRADANALWHEVEAINQRNPNGEAERYRLYFYFGQYLQNESATQEDV